jgi:hypothetical protein
MGDGGLWGVLGGTLLTLATVVASASSESNKRPNTCVITFLDFLLTRIILSPDHQHFSFSQKLLHIWKYGDHSQKNLY